VRIGQFVLPWRNAIFGIYQMPVIGYSNTIPAQDIFLGLTKILM